MDGVFVDPQTGQRYRHDPVADVYTPINTRRAWIIGTAIACGIYAIAIWPILSAAGIIQSAPLAIDASEMSRDDAPIAAGKDTVISRKDNGHYMASVVIGGRTIPMMVDTGASTISLSHADASRAGVDVRSLRYTALMQTANGVKTAAFTRLPRVTVGGIEMADVDAVVGHAGEDTPALLGLSFLGRLRSYEFAREKLTLRP